MHVQDSTISPCSTLRERDEDYVNNELLTSGLSIWPLALCCDLQSRDKLAGTKGRYSVIEILDRIQESCYQIFYP